MNNEIQIIIWMEIVIMFSELLYSVKKTEYRKVPKLFICIVIYIYRIELT